MGGRTNAIWTIWIELSPAPRLFLFLLALVAIYTFIVATSTMVRLHAMRKPENSKAVRHAISVLDARLANTRQVLSAAFYLFGAVLFFALKNAFWTTESRKPVGTLILNNFFIVFVFAGNVFFFFLILHLVQWFAASRVRRYALNHNLLHPD
jgi:hypothetical protein